MSIDLDELDPKTITEEEISVLEKLDAVDIDPAEKCDLEPEESSKSDQEFENPSSKFQGGKVDKTKRQTNKTYQQKFQRRWQSEFNWVFQSKSKTMCKICNTSVAGGRFHLKRHAVSAQHTKKNCSYLKGTRYCRGYG